MPSQASQQIRATFVKATEPDSRSLAEQRLAWETEASREPLPPAVTITPLLLQEVPCELVQITSCEPSQVLIWLHGGGFTQGSCKTHRRLATQLAEATLCSILLIDYRLAPEHPFPAAVQDEVAVYQALLTAGAPASQIIIGGDSAGGGLAMPGKRTKGQGPSTKEIPQRLISKGARCATSSRPTTRPRATSVVRLPPTSVARSRSAATRASVTAAACPCAVSARRPTRAPARARRRPWPARRRPARSSSPTVLPPRGRPRADDLNQNG